MLVLLGLVFSVMRRTNASLSPWTVAFYRQANQAIGELEESVVKRKQIVPDLGLKFDEIMATAMRASRHCRILERAIDARCEVVFAKQLQLLRAEALDKLRTFSDDDDSRAQVDAEFCTAAARSMRADCDWDYALERASLDDVASTYMFHKLRAADVQLDAAQQQANYMRLYQTYNSQIQHLQASQFSRPQIPLAAAFAYRVPDSDINLSGNFQQGKASLQLTKLDDPTILVGDPATILAPSRGNLGFSINA